MRPAGAYMNFTWLRTAGLLIFLWLPCQAAAQTLPDTSDWRSYSADDYGVSIKVPPDWRLDEASMSRGDILSFRAPDLPGKPPAGCGIKAFNLGSDKPVDLDAYIRAMSKEERFLRALQKTFGKPHIHDVSVVQLADRKAFHSIVSGNLTNARWTFMNFDTADGTLFFKLQCFMNPRTVEDHYYTFMAIGLSLTFSAG